MAARRPFWKWHRWKSIGFCLWPPSTCIWNLKFKFQSKLDLCSGNHVVYRQTDGQTDGRTDGQGESSIPPSNFVGRGYKNNPSRTVDATERTGFSRSRPNDLEDIGQGQRSSHATHLLMLVIICTKYGKNPSRTVDVTERTRQAGQTDGWTDGRTETNIPPNNFVVRGGYNNTGRNQVKIRMFSLKEMLLNFFHWGLVRRYGNINLDQYWLR